MEVLVLEVGIAIMLFLGTNIDDVFVLLAFFSDNRFQVKEVVVGQFLGILTLTLGSFALSFGTKQIPQNYIGLLGLIPFFMGIYKLWEVLRASSRDEEVEVHPLSAITHSAKIFSVAGVTIANGGDNLGVYIPLFTTKSFGTLGLDLLIFLIMTAVWCYVAHYLISHRRIGVLLKRYGHYLIPGVFIGLGFYILHKSDSLNFLKQMHLP